VKTKLGIKIGADPEFTFTDASGNFVPASRVFSGHDTRSRLGTDGCDSTAELRPEEGSYYEVAQRVNNLLNQANRLGYKAYAGSGPHQPTGGHIHFSGIIADRRLITRLDKFIASPLNTVSDRSRRRGYGRLGEVRSQPWGWEYRAPLSWLSTPILTRGTLAIAWILARAFKFGDIESINRQQDLIEYAYKGERIATKLFFEAIKTYKREGKDLESIEIFGAWNKTNKAKPSHFPTFSEDAMMADIHSFILGTQGNRRTRKRYNPYDCYHHIRLFGVRQDRARAKTILVNSEMARLMATNHLGAMVQLDYNLPTYHVGLSWTLRQNLKACSWAIKRIVKAINDQHELDNGLTTSPTSTNVPDNPRQATDRAINATISDMPQDADSIIADTELTDVAQGGAS